MLARTLSLATVAAAVAGVAVGFINELRFISRAGEVAFSPQVAMGLAESLVPLFFGFGCLTVARLCVTLGLWRVHERKFTRAPAESRRMRPIDVATSEAGELESERIGIEWRKSLSAATK